MIQFLSSFTQKINNWYSKPKTVIILSIIFLVLLIYIDSTYSFIGRGDYANYSNVARNILLGKGFSVDYLAFHYIQYPQVTHPEDMWPLLQPVWIAISYLFLGVNPLAARIPNAIFLVALGLLTYFIGKKLFNEKVAFWALILTILNTSLIRYATDWITSDIALAVFSLIIFYLGYLVVLEAHRGYITNFKIIWLGIFSGMAILQKPMGVLLPVVYFLYLAFFFRKKINKFIRPGLLFIGSTFLVCGWFFIRNLILFGTLLLPNEHYLGFLIKYFPYETIFNIWYPDPPSLKLWLDYGLINFLKINFSYLRYSIDTFIFRDLLMPYTVIVLSLVGLTFITDKRKHFFYPLVILFLIMSILMATYWHYESRYYAMLLPVFNILAMVAFIKFFPRITFKNVLIIVIFAFITFLPSVKTIFEGVKTKTTDPALTAYTWIKNNTPEGSVIMTLAPWEMNFHSERKTIMIPNENRETILWMAKKYNSNYLELEFLGEIKRPELKKEYQGKGAKEFTPIYQDPGKYYIYKINWDKIELDPKTKPGWY